MKIDRERLVNEVDKVCAKTGCMSCKYKSEIYCEAILAINILEQNPDLITDLPQNTEQIPLPVKSIWTLKPEFQQFCKDHDIPMSFELPMEPQQRKEYYDCKTEPDYSEVPVGAVIEISTRADSYFGIVKENDRNKITIGYTLCTDVIDRSKNNLFFYYSNIKSLTILKLPENTK